MRPPIENLEEFIQRVNRHDWFADMSDSHNVYLSGNFDRKAIEAFAAKHAEAQIVWDLASKDLSMHFFAQQLIGAVFTALTSEESKTFCCSHDVL